MTFSGHASVAVIILKYIPDPFAVALLNIILHLPLDGIPHAEWSTFRDSKMKIFLITALDLLAGVIVLFLAYQYLSLPIYLIGLAVISSLWLDILEIISLGRWKALRRFHNSLHTWPEKPDDPVDWGKTVTGRTPTWLKLTIQTLLVVSSVLLLTR